ncbi:MAG TPA: CehA/McbA family metallohydrolase [Kofleriaceae bacterium]|nr:CehA/McbA family metallohydrolase [Kofleriaceae bacterium]
MNRVAFVSFIALLMHGCGDDAATCALPFADGDPTGHAEPLGAGPGEARAGRIHGEQLAPPGVGVPQLLTWADNDFVIANNRVALVIEDVGDSDLYDPWGGRPVGLARVENGHIAEPSNFGEFFILTGRSTVVTESVSVINDGSHGGTAIIRARGKLHPLPFFEPLTAILFNDEYTDIEAAIDYELAPDADHVDIRVRYHSPRSMETKVPSTMHGLMYSGRTSPTVFQPNVGFDSQLSSTPYVAFVEDNATSWAYMPGEGTLGSSIAASGFLGAFGPGYTIPPCGSEFDRLAVKLIVGGPGLDPVQTAAAKLTGENREREITGTVQRGGQNLLGVHVHAIDAAGHYLSRATTQGARGGFTLHVPAGADITLRAYTRETGLVDVPATSDSMTITLPPVGYVNVVATENGAAVPARIQVLSTAAPPPANYGEPDIAGGRMHVVYAEGGHADELPVPPGTYTVITSRGFEYETDEQTVTVAADQTKTVTATLDRVVDTTGIQCGDFHVHTWRSNDSGDTGLDKVRQAVADGVELPVRSDHEWVADFAWEIAQLGVEKFAAGFGSIELTSMELWGHMGVFPLTPDPTQPNAGAPKWQTFPTAAKLDEKFETLAPPVVFDAVRARPEAPVVIINHPRGKTNYFGYVGYDPATGLASSVADWDTKFTLVEVFNNAGWQQNKNGTVVDWFGLLKAGRKVFATGSSDSHHSSSSPVGYPRTCIALGTDDPRQLTANLVRDQLAAGHSTISGGIYVTAKIGTAGPGDTVNGAGSPMNVDVTIQAATWVDVDSIDVVVDGTIVDTIPVMPGDADPQNPVIRWRKQIPIQAQATGGFVVIAAYGAGDLSPVHPGYKPFGMTNPIFVAP